MYYIALAYRHLSLTTDNKYMNIYIADNENVWNIWKNRFTSWIATDQTCLVLNIPNAFDLYLKVKVSTLFNIMKVWVKPWG